jgi:hypothetical protein
VATINLVFHFMNKMRQYRAAGAIDAEVPEVGNTDDGLLDIGVYLCMSPGWFHLSHLMFGGDDDDSSDESTLHGGAHASSGSGSDGPEAPPSDELALFAARDSDFSPMEMDE